VIDRADGAGRETSFAQWSLLTPACQSHGMRRDVANIAWLTAAVGCRAAAEPARAPLVSWWGHHVPANHGPAAFERNTLSKLALTLYSLKVLQSLRQQTGIGMAARRGIAQEIRDNVDLDRASGLRRALQSEG